MRVLLVVYDDGAHLHLFPLGMAYLAAILQDEGFDVEIYSQDLHHYPENHLTSFLNTNQFDLVGVGVIGGYYQYRKLIKISKAINSSKQRPFFVIGGHGPSPEPEFFLRKTQADAVVIGEGERSFVKLLNALSNGTSLKYVKGIAYREEDRIYVNDRRPLIEDIDSIPWPLYDLFPIEYYRLMRPPHASRTDFVICMITGRGCPFKCNFCYRMDEGIRFRKIENIVEEIQYLKKTYGITYIFFYDELFMSSVERTEKLCKAFIQNKLNLKWFCSGRLNFARENLLRLMKEAGCVSISYGIEALDNQILINMNKALNTKQILDGIEATLRAGINPGFNVIFGNIGESKETLQKGVEFLLKYDDCVQFRNIRPVTPYPGSELYYHAIEKGLLRDCEDFYENKHINSDLLTVNFTNMSDDEFYRCLFEANQRLMKNYFEMKLLKGLEEVNKIYLQKDASFRGFRHT